MCKEDQRAIVDKLKSIGFDAASLVHELSGQEDVAELLAELRSAQKEAAWRAIRPHHDRLWKAFDKLTHALHQRQVPLPEGAHDAFVDFVGALSRPVRELDLHATEDSPALSSRRAEARRQRPGSRTRGIKAIQAQPARSIAAIRQRFMPFVRRVIATKINAALRAREEKRRRNARGRRDTPQQISRRINRPSYQLTAAFIRAFYPWFGAGTTEEHVRKSLR